MLTFTELMDAFERGDLDDFDVSLLERAKEYEIELLSQKGYRFPEKGDLYVSSTELLVTYITVWAAPFSHGGKALLPKGEKIWIDTDLSDTKPLLVYASPVDFKKIEQVMIPEVQRTEEGYGGFCLSLTTKVLNESFILLDTGFSVEKNSTEF
ncbi:hypothetical protein QLX67_06915 [Balneolaceae bacterium ANBcel3]|nr:hypothetical protein [Balneolaceae bacterium ANBcel3]